LVVNPFDTLQVGYALHQALHMEREERLRRIRGMRTRVLEFDADYWARTFVDDLTNQEQELRGPMSVFESAEAILRRFEGAARAALFLDYDGTLREFEALPQQAYPSAEVRKVLEGLHRQREIDVFIISGRKRDDLDAWFGRYRFTLIGEHGTSFRDPKTGKWKLIHENVDLSWKRRVIEILKHYEGSTPGSFVEEKSSAVVWHYRRSDPEFGLWKAHQLMSEIYDMVANMPVEIHHGKKIVEVSSIHVSKGAALEKFVREKKYDFVLCAGDDQTDEGMFRIERPGLIKIKVGEGDTHADYRVSSPSHFRQLLLRLIDARASARSVA
jgi:trehalose 6-phosphate synthase/phosphatase